MKRFNRYLSATLSGVLAIGSAGTQNVLAADFTVRIENVSTPHTLRTTKGDKSVGISPGAWVLHSGNNPIYTLGQPASVGLEHQAEDGNPEGLYSDLQTIPGVKATGAFDYAAQPYPVAGFIGPKQAFEFVIPGAAPGDRLSFSTMFIESNDWFLSNNSKGIELFSPDGRAFSGDVTAMIGLWDAGTEANEEAGTGMNQAPRQGRPDTGKTTKDAVKAVVPTANTPSASGVVKVTIMPRP